LLLNRLEFALVNNPARAALQRHFESRRFLRMAGPMHGGKALELGCGRGVGTSLILDLFGADAVDAFDLDPRMVALARQRLRAALQEAGLAAHAMKQLWGTVAWFTATKPSGPELADRAQQNEARISRRA
jgi:hypothetical protein